MPPVQYGGDEVSALVLDIGSNTTRAGYAGEDCPKTVFPTTFASIPSPDSPTHIHGNSVHLYRPSAIHSSPITDGLITDWDAISRVLEHAFKDRLRLPTLEDYPLLVTEPSWNTKENREKMIEEVFEKWDAPAYYAVDRAVMTAFASGKGSAMVLDVGDELTSVVPIYDGFVLRKAVQKQPAAGALLSDVLLSTLKSTAPTTPINPHYLVKSKEPVDASAPAKAVLRTERQPNSEDPACPTTPSYHKSQEKRVMHEFKETVCEVYNVQWDDAGTAARPSRPFEFPDGYNAYYGTMRMSVPEILFNPSRFLPKEFSTLPLPSSLSTIPSHPYSSLQPINRLFSNSLVQIDPDLHATLMANVVVTGGTTLMPGFVDRLNVELGAMAGGMKLKIHAPSSPAERMYSSWLGGSILASLGTFHQLWIGKDEYKEMGAARLVKK
ncbi:actin-related protein Arp4p [Pseudohyphozyma bogoriensis]|nr:actin-related protein Arp4p [Pseudohyphozyma bogoriensis]